MSDFYPYAYKGYPVGLKYPWTFPMPSKKEGEKRWQTIRKAMQRHNFDGLIVGAPVGYMPVSPIHLVYISNYVPFYNKGTYVLFPLQGEPLLVASTALGPQFQHCATATSWIKDIIGSLNPIQEIVNKIKQLKLQDSQIGVVGYNSEVFPASAYDVLRNSLPKAIFRDATSMLGEAMNEVSRNSEEELAFLKKACEFLDLAHKAVCEIAKPGVKECELWAVIEQTLVKNGSWYGHFLIGTSGPNPTFLRGPASQSALKKGDVFLFEIDPIYGGVSPQMMYSVSLGRPNKEVAKMFHFCEELYQYSLVELEKNRTFIDIEMDLIRRIHEAGYEPLTPQIHRYNMALVMPTHSLPQSGDYFTVHPNIANKDYTAGAKVGDEVRITRDGKVERLMKTPARLTIV